MSYCTVQCSVSDKQEAVSISKHLVEKKLIACCNIIPSVTSVYEWKGKINEDSEALMIMKTRTELFKEVEAEIKKLHSYDLPEIICIPVIDGSKEYLSWVNEQTEK